MWKLILIMWALNSGPDTTMLIIDNYATQADCFASYYEVDKDAKKVDVVVAGLCVKSEQ